MHINRLSPITTRKSNRKNITTIYVWQGIFYYTIYIWFWKHIRKYNLVLGRAHALLTWVLADVLLTLHVQHKLYCHAMP